MKYVVCQMVTSDRAKTSGEVGYGKHNQEGTGKDEEDNVGKTKWKGVCEQILKRNEVKLQAM